MKAYPRYLPAAQVVLETVQAGQVEAVTLIVTLMELTVHPRREQQAMIARQHVARLVHFPHLQMAEVNRGIVRRAAQVRALHNLRPADAP